MHRFRSPARPRWEIFCQVVDNFGDIGVCWRLATDLARRGGGAVRLWVVEWEALRRICPAATAVDERAGGSVQGVELRRWTSAFVPLVPGEIVVEAFACELPTAQLEAMAALRQAPLWINLEYLSAEAWVAGCHGMASPHPRLPLVKHFFFPGFDAGTGGLPREADLLAPKDPQHFEQLRLEPVAEARGVARQFLHRRDEGIVTANLGLLSADVGRREEARSLYAAAVAIARETSASASPMKDNLPAAGVTFTAVAPCTCSV